METQGSDVAAGEDFYAAELPFTSVDLPAGRPISTKPRLGPEENVGKKARLE